MARYNLINLLHHSALSQLYETYICPLSSPPFHCCSHSLYICGILTLFYRGVNNILSFRRLCVDCHVETRSFTLFVCLAAVYPYYYT